MIGSCVAAVCVYPEQRGRFSEVRRGQMDRWTTNPNYYPEITRKPTSLPVNLADSCFKYKALLCVRYEGKVSNN